MRTAIILIIIFLTGCVEETKVITSGNYGPLEIGDTKQETMDKASKHVEIKFIRPIVSEKIYIESPDNSDLKKLDTENGIVIWVNKDPQPLRVEFLDNKVAKTWGASNKCIASKESMNIACRKTSSINQEIHTGNSRAEVYEVVTKNKNGVSIQVGNFVPGYQQFRIGQSTDIDLYKELLLKNNAWEFTGLKTLSKYQDPFYSRISLYFQSERLAKIIHWSSPYEMP